MVPNFVKLSLFAVLHLWSNKINQTTYYQNHSISNQWRIHRLKYEGRKMLPADDFEKFEDIVKSLKSQKWQDPSPPALPSYFFWCPSWKDPEIAYENRNTNCCLLKRPLLDPSSDSLDPNDVHQGAIGDCWFMAAASTVAMVDELDKRWLGRHDEDKGVYEFIFYDETDSSQRRVCVDRKIPLIKTCRLKGTCFG